MRRWDYRGWTWIAVTYAGMSLIFIPSRTPLVGPDSARYLPPADLLAVSEPGVLTTAVYRAAGGAPAWIILLQALLATAAWLLLSFSLLRLVRGVVGLGVATFVLVYSTLAPIASWQWMALSDGLALSVFTAWAASSLVLVRRPMPAPSAMLLNAAMIILAALVRPQLLIVIVPVQVLVIAWTWRGNDALGRVVAVAGPVIATLWGGFRLIGLAVEPGFRLLYTSNNMVGKPSFREWVLVQAGPCGLVSSEGGSFAGMLEWLSSPTALRDCPSVWALVRDVDGTPVSWLMARPNDALGSFLKDLAALSYPLYTDESGLLASVVDAVLLPTSVSIGVLLAAYAGVGLVAALLLRRLSWPRPRSGAALAVTLASSAAYLLLTWISDGMEMGRHMQPVLSLLPLVFATAPIVWNSVDRPEGVESTNGGDGQRTHSVLAG